MISKLLLFLALTSPSWGLARVSGWCEKGSLPVVAPQSVGGSPVSIKVQQSFPACTVNVFITGTGTQATIYSNNSNPPTPLSPPFTAASNGYYFFYAPNGRYDVQISGSGLSVPFTFGDISVFDESSLWFDVTNYGASPLASASVNVASIQAAAAAAAPVGGTVIIPCGTYSLSSSVTFDQGTTVTGYGSFSCSTILYTGTSGAAFVFASAIPSNTNASIRRGGVRDLQLTGGNISSGTYGLFLGGDPAGIVSPSAYQGEHQFFSNVNINNFDTGILCGNNCYNTAFFEMFIQFNNRGFWMPSSTNGNTGSNMDFHDGIFLGNLVAGVQADPGGTKLNFFGTQFEYNVIGLTGATLSAYLVGVHFENDSDTGCANCGPFVSVNNTSAYVKLGCTNCSVNMHTGGTNMFYINASRMTLDTTALEAYAGGSQTNLFNITVQNLYQTQIHVDQISGDENNNIVNIFSASTPLQSVWYQVHPNATIQAGQVCLQCVTPDPSGSALTIGAAFANNNPLLLAPPLVTLGAPSSGTSRRVGQVFGNWLLEQDTQASGVTDWGLYNNATSKLYNWLSPTTGNVCEGVGGSTGCANSAFAHKLVANAAGVTQYAIIDGPNQSNLAELVFEATDGGSQLGMFVGTGSPNGVVTANPGSLYFNRSGGQGTSLFVKESGSASNTGWVGYNGAGVGVTGAKVAGSCTFTLVNGIITGVAGC